MALIKPSSVIQEIDSWEQAYKFEKYQRSNKFLVDEAIKNKAIKEYEDTCNEVMKISEELKQKYSFLPNFMEKNKISVVDELVYSDEILDKSWKVTLYDDDASWTIYYVVNGNWEITKIPYEQIDRSSNMFDYMPEDWINIDNWFRKEQVQDFIGNDTRYILEHHYNNAWNEQSPLYVIDFNLVK